MSIFEETKNSVLQEKYTFIARTVFAVITALLGFLTFIFAAGQIIDSNTAFQFKLYALPSFAFGIVGGIAYVASVFSTTVGAVLFLCNTLMLFSHFWMVLPLTQSSGSTFFWTALSLCEFLMFGLNFMMCGISFYVACKQPTEDGYDAQINE
eukprot:gene10341-2755_t